VAAIAVEMASLPRIRIGSDKDCCMAVYERL
jgi:hypothetical protein